MKTNIIIVLLAFSTFLTACSQTTDAKNDEAPDKAKIVFDTQEHNYGNIKKGGNGEYEFVFTNEGKEPLVLSNVRSSCGCTVPKWPKEPIKKGEEASIKVKYNTQKIGTFSKSVTVYSNASNNPVVLRIKGKVIAEETAAAAE